METPEIKFILTDEDALLDHRVEGANDTILLRSRETFAASPGTRYVTEVSPVSEPHNTMKWEAQGEFLTLIAFAALYVLYCLVQACAECQETCQCCCCCCCCDSGCCDGACCSGDCCCCLVPLLECCSDDRRRAPSAAERWRPPQTDVRPLRGLAMDAIIRDPRPNMQHLEGHIPSTLVDELEALNGRPVAVVHRNP